jgi:hypothetical protein
MVAALQALARGESLGVATIAPGRRFEDAKTPEERGTAPSSLLDLVDLVGAGPLTLDEATRALIERGQARERVVSEREALAAVRVSIALEWVRG